MVLIPIDTVESIASMKDGERRRFYGYALDTRDTWLTLLVARFQGALKCDRLNVEYEVDFWNEMVALLENFCYV